MTSDSKTTQLDCGADRISNLPRNLIDEILKHLPVHDVARTSILSRTWRNIWGTQTQLVFDKDFFSQLVSKKNKRTQIILALRTVNDILLLHSGPILKFHLFIPQDLPLHECLDTDFWIKNISNSGVREFGLHNSQKMPYSMPSYLFSCLELNDLNLTFCVLKPPLGFGGFCNLLSLRLTDVIITGDMSFGPKLDELIVQNCTGIKHLGCLFKNYSNLQILVIIGSEEIDWQLFECTPKPQLVSMALKGVTDPKKKIVNLEKFVGSMPKINHLLIDDLFLESLEPGATISKMLTTTMKNIKDLTFDNVGFHDLVQIQSVICLVRGSANLRNLFIELNPKGKGRDGLDLGAASKDHVLSVEKYLQLPNIKDMILEQLQTVDISGIVGSRSEIHFIKLLLVSSPSLKSLSLRYNTTIDDHKEKVRSWISQELFCINSCASTAVHQQL